jgi:hypothetical protein
MMEVKNIYNSKNFNLFCKENDIIKQLTIPYMLEKIVYGIVERRNPIFGFVVKENMVCRLL